MNQFPAQRPKQNATGPTVSLTTNMLALRGSINKTVYNYLVTFQPEVKSSLAHIYFLKVLKVHSEHFKNTKVAFDGFNMLVADIKIPDKELEFMQSTGSRQQLFKMCITFKNSVDFGDINRFITNRENVDISLHVQMLETILRHHQQCNFYTERRRAFSGTERQSLPGGLELWSGLTQCVKVTNKGLLLNADMSFAVFYEEIPLLELVRKLKNIGPGERLEGAIKEHEFYRDLDSFLRGAKLTTTHLKTNPKFKISGIMCTPASEVYFESREGTCEKKMSVAEYFSERHFPLRYPHLPVVVLKKREIELYFPLEVLKVLPTQKYKGKLNERQSADMMKFAARAPKVRFDFLKRSISEMGLVDNPVVGGFGIVFDANFAKCRGRVLKAPNIAYGASVVTPERGSWSLRGVTALKPVSICKWVVFSMGRVETRTIQTNIGMLIQYGEKFGVKLDENYTIREVETPAKYFDVLEKEAPVLAIVLLRTRSTTVYKEIKKIAETRGRGVVTQCILLSNLRNLCKPSFAGNILIKINAKLGGKNAKLQLGTSVTKVPVIVFGADLAHPGVGSMCTKSTVAIVASMDKDLGRYATSIKIQDKGQEIIENLEVDVKDMIIKFRDRNRVEPQQIIFFRDGVGESQFYAVFKREAEAVKKACRSIRTDYNPQLTFIVAQKRHSVRFMDDSNSENVAPGTVVEEIGHPIYFDFYLVSHRAIQGTARPIRYQVLLNESGYSAEELQEFIHNYSYLYARATKAVSLVPPIYYAHLAAARASAYMEMSPYTNEVKMNSPVKHLLDKLYYL
eukprot:jgi/Antlo1/2005/2396